MRTLTLLGVGCAPSVGCASTGTKPVASTGASGSHAAMGMSDDVDEDFEQSWARSDVWIVASRF